MVLVASVEIPSLSRLLCCAVQMRKPRGGRLDEERVGERGEL